MQFWEIWQTYLNNIEDKFEKYGRKILKILEANLENIEGKFEKHG